MVPSPSIRPELTVIMALPGGVCPDNFFASSRISSEFWQA